MTRLEFLISPLIALVRPKVKSAGTRWVDGRGTIPSCDDVTALEVYDRWVKSQVDVMKGMVTVLNKGDVAKYLVYGHVQPYLNGVKVAHPIHADERTGTITEIATYINSEGIKCWHTPRIPDTWSHLPNHYPWGHCVVREVRGDVRIEII